MIVVYMGRHTMIKMKHFRNVKLILRLILIVLDASLAHGNPLLCFI